jgi:hypothetical protein
MSTSRIPGIIGLMLALIAGALSLAAAANPDISIKKKYVEIFVTVDPAFKPIAGLFDNSLAEGKAWAAKMDGTATAEWKSNPSSFRDGLGWNYERDYALRSLIGHYASVVRSDGTFALARAASLAVAASKLANGINGYGDDNTPASKMTPEQELATDTFIKDGIKPALLQVGPVTLTPSSESGKSAGLTFHYSPYAVGPYAEGPHTAFVPWTAFQPYLSADGKALFGGTQPQADVKQWE